MTRRRALIWAARAATALIVIGGWQLFTGLKIVDPFFYGQPTGIVKQLGDWINHGTEYGSIWLQVWITKDGRRIARVDYHWAQIRLVGEFDGLQKYLRSQKLSGKSASQAVVEEKLREDEIRSTGERVVRWVWADLLEPARFAAILHRAGVPRRTTARAAWR